MDNQVDHYVVLGLPSGEEGAKLSKEAINKAYKKMAQIVHPDKRDDKLQAHADFVQLTASHKILMDEKSRKSFDDLLLRRRQVKRQKIRRHQSQRDHKRQKRERDASTNDRRRASKAQEEDERTHKKILEELIAQARARYAARKAALMARIRKQVEERGMDGGGSKRKLKVSWEVIGEDYSGEQLREVFEEFGEVKDVSIRRSLKKGKRRAYIEMASRDAAFAAIGSVRGKHSNPLQVRLVRPRPSAKKT